MLLLGEGGGGCICVGGGDLMCFCWGRGVHLCRGGEGI